MTQDQIEIVRGLVEHAHDEEERRQQNIALRIVSGMLAIAFVCMTCLWWFAR